MQITPAIAEAAQDAAELHNTPAAASGDQLQVDFTSLHLLSEATELARRGHYADAETLIRRALCSPSGISAALWDLLARVYAQQGRYFDAECCWREALTLSPGTLEYSEGIRAIARERRPAPIWSGAKWCLAILLFAAAGFVGMAAYAYVSGAATSPRDQKFEQQQ